ncbi:carotenoid cleavage dioxygenase 1 [Arthroderma uncinatum]|uniref:carotenoid cleavage dioxygenase 1 n=1 Tax=Arthroderma uncinatum TaxID=74035 RepID=UPI00144AD4EF|nr:carotenoid cleavage dioxygenase 1 [Arthroderma uncinatum]KAF3481704.1 carotenoid cleavage dioxygenase 1 [Arthroderma uncinatum]
MANKKKDGGCTHMYLKGNFAPIHNVCPPTPCDHIGDIPKELIGGQYVRNGGNPLTNDDLGRDAHWFDGDGMLSGVFFRRLKGTAVQAEYVNNYVLTDVYLAALANPKLRQPILPSVTTLINPRTTLGKIVYSICRTLVLVLWSYVNGSRRPIKKISVVNTNIIYHDGRALATCESGPPMRVSLPGLETVGWFNGWKAEGEPGDLDLHSSRLGFGGIGLTGFLNEWTTGHPRADPQTRELVLFHSTFFPPFVHYSVVPDSRVQHGLLEPQSPLLNIPVPGIKSAKMMHDFGVSHEHTVIIDLPLSLDPVNLAYNKPVIAYEVDGCTRFGIFPRYKPDQVRWFETAPCCIFHTTNTWESEGGEGGIDGLVLNMLVCRMTTPAIIFNAGNIPSPAGIDKLEKECRLYYYQFDLSQATNVISHQWALSAIPFELPHVPKNLAMSSTRFVYGCSLSNGTFTAALGRAAKVDCLAKVDVRALINEGIKRPPMSVTGCVDGRSVQEILSSNNPEDPIRIFPMPSGWYAQECSFVPRANGISEDDGWLLTFVFDESQLDEDGNAPRAMALVPPLAAEFTVTPTNPQDHIVSACPSTRSRYDDVLVHEKSDTEGEERPGGPAEVRNGSHHGDSEAQSAGLPNDGVYYPEGGFEAWMVVVGSCFGTAVTLGMMNTVGTLQAYVVEHQLKQYDEGTTGWIFSTFIFLGFFGGVQVGPVFDAHGPRLLMLAGSVCMGVSMMLLGLCTQYWHFMLCFGILGGTGASLIFTPALSAISHWFSEKRATATGIAAAGGSVGGIVFPLALQKLYTVVSFAWATRIVGFAVIFCCAVAVILVRSRLPPKPGQTVIPSVRIFRNQAYLSVTLGTYFMEWALFVPIAYITAFALSTGAMSLEFSYQLIAIMNAGSSIGRALPGYVADKLGRFNSMVAALVICTAMTITLWLPASLLTTTPSSAPTIKALSIVFALIFGFASGSNVSLAPVCVGQLCDTNEYGRYYATCYTIVSFGTLTGIPIAGSLLRLTDGRYWGVVLWTTLCYVISLACFIWSRACCVGWKLGVKF